MGRALIKKVQNAVFQNNLWKKGDKIVVGVSGGPDSVCLLNTLFSLQKKYDLKIIAVHVNYGLRGKDSDEDEKLVRELAEKYGISLKVLKSKFKAKSNLEDNLRNIRYDFFEKVRSENNFDLIAVAHNADDQAETFLMRVIRGSGTEGLAAMKFKNNRIIRPLLVISRKEILEYLKEEKLKWRLDKTNLETKFFRNKIRNKLIPYLEKNFNPAIKKILLDSTFSIAEDQDFINDLVEKKFKKMSSLRISEILKFHPALQKRILRRAILEARSDLKNIGSSHIEEILKIVKSTKSKAQIAVFQGLKIVRRGDKLEITRKTLNS